MLYTDHRDPTRLSKPTKGIPSRRPSESRALALFHDHHGAESLQCVDDLLAFLLGHSIFHLLGRALDELFAVDQTQTQHALNFLDNLGLCAGVERLECQLKQRLLLRLGCCFLLLNWCSRGGWASGRKSTDREIWNVETCLYSREVSMSLEAGRFRPSRPRESFVALRIQRHSAREHAP